MANNDTATTEKRWVPIKEDHRGNPVQGLYSFCGSYYGNVRVVGPNGKSQPRKIHLKEATSVREAVAALTLLKAKRIPRALPQSGTAPEFTEAVTNYEDYYAAATSQMAESTLNRHKDCFKSLSKFFAGVKLHKITKQQIAAYIP